jgi:protein-disulfide isomerase
VGGVPVALIGVVFFAFVLLLIALCQRSFTARRNLPGYVFALSTVGLAGVLYLAYASLFVLNVVCLLCVGTYAAMVGLFVLSGVAATSYPMSSLPRRASQDMRALARTPAALGIVVAFVVAAIVSVTFFPGEPLAASAQSAPLSPSAPTGTPQAPPVPQNAIEQVERFLEAAPRVPIVAAASGAAVVIFKYNDYQCPPCRQTFMDFKPVLANLQQEYPGQIAFITRDFPLDPECNSIGGGHQAACEAAVAVRLAREKGRADAMEEWLFANQPTLTPDVVKEGLTMVAGVTDFDARYPQTLQLVKTDIALGRQLDVRGTPTFFMNGIRLPNFNRGEYFDAAVRWELRRLGVAK